MAKQKKGGKNGSRKIGRMKIKGERYKQEQRREKNKLRKLNKYLKHHPNNKVAEERRDELFLLVG